MINCEFEHGAKANLRHVTCDTVVTSDQGILLVKRAPFLQDGGKWCLPGGYLDRDENALEGATREVFEETGYRVTNSILFELVSSADRSDYGRQNVGFIFVSEVGALEGTPDHESSAVDWFPLNALPLTSEIAFDHARIIAAYANHLVSPMTLPVFR